MAEYNDAAGADYPIKKILMLLWHTLAIDLGTETDAVAAAAAARAERGLAAWPPALRSTQAEVEAYSNNIATRFLCALGVCCCVVDGYRGGGVTGCSDMRRAGEQ